MKIDNELMTDISGYMDDVKREYVHTRLAPCTKEYFLKEYCKLDTDFEYFLDVEFGIDIDELE